MAASGVDRKQLAAQLGERPGRVARVLHGDGDITMGGVRGRASACACRGAATESDLWLDAADVRAALSRLLPEDMDVANRQLRELREHDEGPDRMVGASRVALSKSKQRKCRSEARGDFHHGLLAERSKGALDLVPP